MARFPMLDGPTIDWDTAREIYRVYSCLYGTDQSLERLSERGGFGWGEVGLFWREHKANLGGHCRCSGTRKDYPCCGG